MFRGLDENSVRRNGDCDRLKVPLYAHQQAELHAMTLLEESENTPIRLDEARTLKSRIGILADKPGAGKSYTMLAHILSRPQATTHDTTQLYTSMFYRNVCITNESKFENIVGTSIIVVPRIVLLQWARYTREMTNVDQSRVYCQQRVSRGSIDAIFHGLYDIAILTEKGYRELSNHPVAEYTLFNRLIIDEGDSIHIPAMNFINYRFMWIMTATPSQMQSYPKTQAIGMLFEMAHATDTMRHVTVQSSEEFVDMSLQLPPITTDVSLVQRPLIHNMIRQFVANDIMDAINAADYGEAIQRIGCETANSEDGVVCAVTTRLSQEIAQAQAALAAPDMESSSTIVAIVRRIQVLQERISHITERVKESDCCPIGLDPIKVKAVTPCCQNAFEFANIMRSLNQKPMCPMCKTELTPECLVVLADVETVTDERKPRKPQTKQAALLAILEGIKETTPDPRILIFSTFDMSMVSSTMRDADITHSLVRGTAARVNNVLEGFAKGDIKALLLNVTHCAAGISLEIATHIITIHTMSSDKYMQLIGRAQRPGRTSPLRVTNIRFEDE